MKKLNKINIKLNGKKLSIKSKMSLKTLLSQLNIPLSKVAIELNKRIVNKKKINIIYLKNNDMIEIVHFIGGG